jgi:hypothetical protein
MWADGESIDPSPTVDQAVNGGYSWLQIECSRCKTKREVDLATLRLCLSQTYWLAVDRESGDADQ